MKKPPKPVLGPTGKPLHFISFSGGRTSAYMTWLLLQEEGHLWDFVVTFANTGREHPKTLEFIHNCDLHFGFNTVWLEAVVDPRPDHGTRHKVVTYETADREGKVFESVIAKYRIPSVKSPHCTREMKMATIDSYCRTFGKAKDMAAVPTSIGIRADEKRRAKPDSCPSVQLPLLKLEAEPGKTSKPRRLFRYPLIEREIEKSDVLRWWKRQAFDLGIEEFEGNCLGCFKKSFAKHGLQIRKDPSVYDWHREMEAKYEGMGTPPDRFFRGGLSTEQLFKLHEQSGGGRGPLFDPEENGGCSESCEFVYTERKVRKARFGRTKPYVPRKNSRLAPWFDQIGVRPHADIAREAGVGPSAVWQIAARKAGKPLRSLTR